MDNLADRFSTLKCKPEDLEVEGDKDVDDILARSKNNDDFEDEDEENDDKDCIESGDDYDDEEGWITPGKILWNKGDLWIVFFIAFYYFRLKLLLSFPRYILILSLSI